MHPSEKVTKQLTVRGRGEGVNPYGQPDRKISAFFLTTSLKEWLTLIHMVQRMGTVYRMDIMDKEG